MRYSIDWHEDATNASPEDRATVADLRLYIDDVNVTTNVQDGVESDHITISLYGLVLGLVHDWWTIFGSRGDTISLRKYRSGFLLPEVEFESDGLRFLVRSEPVDYRSEGIEFPNTAAATLSREQFESWLRSLIADVLLRLKTKGLPDTSAAQRWTKILNTSDIASEANFCEAAGCLGVDPYSIDDDTASFIEVAEEIFTDKEALIDWLSSSRIADRHSLLRWVAGSYRRAKFSYRLPLLRRASLHINQHHLNRSFDSLESKSIVAANAYFKYVSSYISSPLEFSDLAHVMAGYDFVESEPMAGLDALRFERKDDIYILVTTTERSVGDKNHIFLSLVCAIGDAILFPNLTASSTHWRSGSYRRSVLLTFAYTFLDLIGTDVNSKPRVEPVAGPTPTIEDGKVAPPIAALLAI